MSDTSSILQEYKQLLKYLQSQNTTVLTPIDNEGQEFWVNAICDPLEGIELLVDGNYKWMDRQQGIKYIEERIKELGSV
jgi:hypothetical protein